MTARTVAYLKANEFTLSGTPGRITPQFMQDTLDSFVPWDLIGGSVAPYVVGGTLNWVAYFQAQGGVIGAGQSSGQHTTNGTALQAAITYAVTNRLRMMSTTSLAVEFDLAGGLIVPAGSDDFCWAGGFATTLLTQFSVSGTGSPVLTVGDTSGSGAGTNGASISGLSLAYGVSVTGKTSAIPLVIGYCQDCEFYDIRIPNWTYFSYDGIALRVPLVGFAGTFSNNFRNIFVWGVQHNFITYDATGTGDHWDNLYCNNGGSDTAVLLSGSYLKFVQGVQNVLFSRCNFEWGICNMMVDMTTTSVNGLKFDACHFEGITLTGSDPAFFFATNSTFQLDSCSVVTPKLLTANLTGGVYSFIADYSDPGIGITALVNNLTLQQNEAAQVNSPLYLYSPLAGALSGDVSNVVINGFWAYDDPVSTGWVGNIVFDPHLALNVAGRMINRFQRYEWGAAGSKIDRLVMTVSTTYTHYGQLRDATLIVPASITGFTITLAVVQGATGNQPVNPGNTVRIRRLGAGVNTGTLALSGATLGSVCNNGQAADFLGIFGGVAPATPTATWGALTPVS